jgi:hypothetical protein
MVYRDMLQQLLIAQGNMAKKDTFTSSKTAHPLISLEKYFITHLPGWFIGRSAPIAWPPCSSDLTPVDFSYGDLLKIECSFQFCPEMLLSSDVELLPQLQK